MQRPTIIVAHKVVLLVLRGLLTGRDLPALHNLTSPQGVVIRIAEGQETILAKAACVSP
jgi:probable phosphoglycerate mutase